MMASFCKNGWLALGLLGAGLTSPARAAGVPLIHVTDLYHSPGDPDDHIDLATVFALPELDVRAVLLDIRPPRQSAAPYEPGFVTVSQLCYLTGRSMPVAAGPRRALRSPQDRLDDSPPREDAAIRLLLQTLRDSPEPVLIDTVGSARIITAAYNRDPELLRRKTRAVIVNAGSSGAGPLEHNVEMDVQAYVGLLRSGLPIDWYPCASHTTDWNSPGATTDHNTFFRTTHAELFRGVPDLLRRWFTFAMTRSARGDILRAMEELPAEEVEKVTSTGARNMWSTASFVLAAGRVLAKTAEGWRFVPAAEVPAGAPTQPLSLEPVRVTVTDAGMTSWEPDPKSNIRLFRRQAGEAHRLAMTEALNALLRTLPAR